MTRRHGDRWLALLLAAFVALAGWYSVTIPLGEAPDEVPHFTYVRYLAEHCRIPDTTEEHEAFQPPLYYALGAALTFWVADRPEAPFAVRANAHLDVTDPRAPKNLLLHTAAENWPYRGWVLAWHLVRLLSIALGAITVWAVYRFGLALFPGPRPAVPLAMAAVVAFTPQFLFMSAVVNNDNAATACSALVLWQIAALLRAALPPELSRELVIRSIALGFTLGLALLSKANLIALVPVVGLAIVLAAGRIPLPRWRAAVGLSGGAGLGLSALLSGWYFLRNWRLHGDPLGWSFLLQINARREGPLTPEVLAWLFTGLFRSYWLGWIGIAFEPLVYGAIAAACLAGAVGFVAGLVRQWESFDSAFRRSLLLFGLYAAILMGSLIKWTMTVLGTDQGRLVYPLLPVGALVLVAGWAWGSRALFRAGPWVLTGPVVGLLALAIVTPVRYIAPVYAPAPVASEEELANAVSLEVNWGDVRLLGYRLENGLVRPGEKLIVDLYWQAERPVLQDLMALIQLVDAEDRFLMYTDGSPTAGRDTTDRWPAGVALASRHLLPIPAYGRPGEYRLTISLHAFGERAWLPLTRPDGSPAGDRLILPEPIHILDPMEREP